MKKVKDFMKMEKLDLFLLNGSYRIVDKNLEQQLENLESQMTKICQEVIDNGMNCSKSKYNKFWKLQKQHLEILTKKADNKEEWMNLKRAAKNRKIDLTRMVISL